MKRTLRGLQHSLRGRLLAGTITWILASVLVAGWALSDLFRQHITRQLMAELSVHMNQLVSALTIDSGGSPALSIELSDPRLRQPYSGLYWQVDRVASNGEPAEAVFRSRSLWDQSLKLPAAPVGAARSELLPLPGPGDRSMLALLQTVTPPEGDATYLLAVAADQRSISEPLDDFRYQLAAFLGLLALGLAAAAVVQVVVGLRPLAQLRERLADVRAGHASRIDGRFPNEIQPMVQEFNAVLESNAEIVERARTQAGNLAHALKTPLSVLANGAAQEPTPFGKLVAEQVDLARRQVDHHLARARAAAAVRTPGRRTEIASVIDSLTRALIRIHSDKGVQLHTEGVPAGIFFLGEQQDLLEMLGNVMENACKWADRNVHVSVEVPESEPPAAARMIALHVDDDGPGLPVEQHDAIFQRGVRLDERRPGSGLGLSIVRDLATTYGGSVHAHPSPLGGLRIELRLPGESEIA